MLNYDETVFMPRLHRLNHDLACIAHSECD